MTRTRRRAKTSKIKERSVTAIFLLLLIGVFSAAGAIMAYHFLGNPDILFTANADKKPSQKTIQLQFEDGKFAIPDYLVRKLHRSALLKIKKISLILPVGWSAGQAPVSFTSKSKLSNWILASIEKRTSVLSEKDRLNNIFRHYIDTPAIAHSSGLYRYKFKTGSSYENIELFLDDLQNPKLIIRCELQHPSGDTRFCDRQLPISSRLTMVYKFPRSYLSQWSQIHKTMQKLLASIYQRSDV